LSRDARDVNVSVTCAWKGFTRASYRTAFVFTINRQSGLGGLRVVSDTAAINIDARHLRDTEEALRQFYRSLP
jgi:hypothetical protein